MSQVTSDTEQTPANRPLPSVSMPILRDERQRLRTRKVVGIGGILFLVMGGAAAVTYYATEPSSTGPKAGSVSPEAAEHVRPHPADAKNTEDTEGDDATVTSPSLALKNPTQQAGTTTGDSSDEAPAATEASGALSEKTEHLFGKARTFREAATSAGLSNIETNQVETALKGVLDFRRCRPADKLTIARDDQGVLTQFRYQSNISEYYLASRTKKGELRGRKVKTPVERTLLKRGGKVKSSLGDALVRVGFQPAVAGLFVEVFSGKADFSVDVRGGDTFRVAVEEERVAGRFIGYGHAKAIEYVGSKTGTLRAFWFGKGRAKHEYYGEDGRSMHGGWLRVPLRYDRITSRFDLKRLHPILKRVVPHRGVDYAASTGTPLWAAADGVIRFAGMKGANGKLVVIRHPNGYSTHYAHLSRIERGIKAGKRVKYRDSIGAVGSTGRSTGPHLHFGVKRGGQFVDPEKVLNAPGKPMHHSAQAAFKRHLRRMKRMLRAIPTT